MTAIATGMPALVGHALACLRLMRQSVDYLSLAWPSIEEGCRIFIRMVSICSSRGAAGRHRCDSRSCVRRALAQSHGRRWLSDARVARQVVDAIRTGESRKRYELHAWVVMPNHVHMLLLERTGSMSLGITGER